MTVFAIAVLLLTALFNLVSWPRFYPRIKNDPRARDENGRATVFLKVHVILIAIALVIAVLSVVAAILLVVQLAS
ncbi:hypothetical protein GCM10027515_17360 [Schumannella luteola]|uniref:Uncharacterized protein n=1 Tax=Schumannella luteola TaxID=472059 RepID=A0A852YT40_9MICO|nr:hypothetical protein [Schumannella luteola]TPX02302.1 hypothetical protein FJ656_23125 [Schumannella luteola]